jgi:hypothetical protein
LSGQISINNIVEQLRKVAHRFAVMKAQASTKSSAGEIENTEDARVALLLKRATKEFDMAKKVLKIMSQNFDYGQALIDLSLKSGATGAITVRASQILGKAPISLWLNLPQRLFFAGIYCPVAYVIGMKTDPEGNFVMEVNFRLDCLILVPNLILFFCLP